ncbi:hypothetical protein CapIbe_000692 [Capra ibex]
MCVCRNTVYRFCHSLERKTTGCEGGICSNLSLDKTFVLIFLQCWGAPDLHSAMKRTEDTVIGLSGIQHLEGDSREGPAAARRSSRRSSGGFFTTEPPDYGIGVRKQI